MSGLAMDEAAVERAARGRELGLPRVPHRGRTGDVRAASTGASMEIHDFRAYQPGDDLRQVDWNAVARTGELILRVRQDEVSPRVEIILDGSRSMALTPAKQARAAELALLLHTLALRQGLAPSLWITGHAPARGEGRAGPDLLRRAVLDGRDDLGSALRRAPPLRACGLRLVVSDFLFEAPLVPLTERLARDAAGLVLLQLLDPEDAQPTGGAGARLHDVESGEALERVLSTAALEAYARRLGEHQRLLREAAGRVRGRLITAVVDGPLDALCAEDLAPLFEPMGAR